MGSLDTDRVVALGLGGRALFVAVTTMTRLPTVGVNVFASAAMLLDIRLPLAQAPPASELPAPLAGSPTMQGN